MGVRLRDRAEVLVPARVPDPANPRRLRPSWDVDPAETIPVRFQGQQSSPVVTTEDGTVLTTWTGRLGPVARWQDETGTHVVDLVAKVTKACRIRHAGNLYSLEEIQPHRRGSRVRFLTLGMRKVPS